MLEFIKWINKASPNPIELRDDVKNIYLPLQVEIALDK